MQQYYEIPQREIIGFYCFIADKPAELTVASKKKKKPRVLNLQTFVQSLINPEKTSQTKTYWFGT